MAKPDRFWHFTDIDIEMGAAVIAGEVEQYLAEVREGQLVACIGEQMRILQMQLVLYSRSCLRAAKAARALAEAVRGPDA